MYTFLKQYQERLINLSSSNNSLVTNNIDRKLTYDLLTVDTFIESESKEILKEIARGVEKIKILPNPQRWYVQNRDVIKNEYEKLWEPAEKKKDNVKYFCDVYLSRGGKEEEFYEFFSIPDDQRERFFDYMAEMTETQINRCIEGIKALRMHNLNSAYEKLKEASSSLEYLNREIELEKKETGISNLCIAYGFIEGMFVEGSCCRAPLGLISVSLLKESGQWFILNETKSNLEINSTFLTAASKNNSIEIDKALEFKVDWGGKIFKQFQEFYYASNIIIADNDYIFSRLSPYSKWEYNDKYKKGQLAIKRYLVLGRFQTTHAIYDDYEIMIQEGMINRQITELLDQKDNKSKVDIEPSVTRLCENDYFFVSKLDTDQEEAIKCAEEKNNCLIIGPPGTGKSETIANIISDSLTKGKRILMVSQKRSAMDVIHNRLSDIGGKIAIIHDADAENKMFYKRVSNQLEAFEEQYKEYYFEKTHYEHDTGFLELEEKVNSESDAIELNVDKLKKIETELYKVRDNGLHLREMYLNAWKINELSEEQRRLIAVHNTLKQHLPEFNLNHFELKTFIERLKEKELLSKYTKYMEMEKSNKLYSHLQNEPKFSELEKLEKNINKVTEILDEIRQKCESEHYTFVYNQYKKNIPSKVLDRKIEDYLSDNFSYLNEATVKGLARSSELIFKRKDLKEREANNKKKYISIETECVKAKRHLETAFASIGMHLNVILRVFNKKAFDELLQQIKDELTVPSYQSFRDMETNYDLYLSLVNELEIIDQMEIEFIKQIVMNINSDDRTLFLDNFVEIVLYDQLSNEMNQMPEIRQMIDDIDMYSELVHTTIDKVETKSNLVKDLIVKKWDDQFIRVAKKDETFSEFMREVDLRGHHRPIKQFVETFEDLILNMFPCFILGPETVSNVLPLKADLFDIIIYDEASQLYLEDAVPSIYRANSAVIVGNDKSLKLSERTFDREIIAMEQDEDSTEASNLLDTAKRAYQPSYLYTHYKSKQNALFNFANSAFYKSELKMYPNLSKSLEERPIERVFVEDALWVDGSNKREAEAVFRIIKDLLLNKNNDETLGVITISTSQCDTIYDFIDAERLKDPIFDKLFEVEDNRKEGNRNVGLFIKPIDQVQGDERDIIIFATEFAKNDSGRNLYHEALAQSEGENLLNVAITRAKNKVILITSFDSEDLEIESTVYLGPKKFKQFLQYSEAVSNRDLEKADSLLLAFNEGGKPNVGKDYLVDSIGSKLEELGYKVDKSIGSSNSLIDLAVYDPKTETYIIGIVCDGPSYREVSSVRERDIHSTICLEKRGWNITRIWSLDWWRDSEKVINDLSIKIDQLLYEKQNEVPLRTVGMAKLNEAAMAAPDFSEISKDNIIGYGDRVLIMSNNNESYEVIMAKSSDIFVEMIPFHQMLFGKELNQTFDFYNERYTVIDIQKMYSGLK